MIRDLIVEEVRDIRRKTEAACEHNWDRLLEHYRQIQNTSGCPVLRGSPKRPGIRAGQDSDQFGPCP
jgi:hypothetical protein